MRAKTTEEEATTPEPIIPEIDPVTGLPFKVGDTLTDEHRPYGTPKDPETGLPIAPPEGEVAPPELGGGEPIPDLLSLTAKEQERHEVLTGKRLQKEFPDNALPGAEHHPRPDQGLPGQKPVVGRPIGRPAPGGPKPDQGLPGQRPGGSPRPDQGLPDTPEPKK